MYLQAKEKAVEKQKKEAPKKEEQTPQQQAK